MTVSDGDCLPVPRKRRRKPLPPIGGQEFKTMRDLEQTVNGIRQMYRPHDTPMVGPDGELMAAYIHHNDGMETAIERHGPVRHVEIRDNPNVSVGAGRPEYDRYQIWVVFADGSAEPFSYRADSNGFAVIDDGFGKFRTALKWVKTAGRHLIAGDMRDYLANHMDHDGTCEISGRPLSPETSDVHHNGDQRSFQWLLFQCLSRWCGRHGLTLMDVEVIDTDNEGGKRFASDALCDEWLMYHSIHARLMALDREVHLQLHKGMTPPPWLQLCPPS